MTRSVRAAKLVAALGAALLLVSGCSSSSSSHHSGHHKHSSSQDNSDDSNSGDSGDSDNSDKSDNSDDSDKSDDSDNSKGGSHNQARGGDNGDDSNNDSNDDNNNDNNDKGGDNGSDGPKTAGVNEKLTIWLTGYSWQDNTPPGSSKVGEPVLHKIAAGTGTFADPITVATPGHAGDQEWKPGTKFYLPTVQRYVIVEDSGAAEAPDGTDTHLDMWIEGQDGSRQATDACMNQFTGKVPAQANPPDGMPVMAGPIYAGKKCNIPPQPANMGTYHDTGN